MLNELHYKMTMEFNKDPENIIVLYYFCVTCFFTEKLTHCNEILKLIRSIYEQRYRGHKYVVLDYYLAKTENIARFIGNMEQKKTDQGMSLATPKNLIKYQVPKGAFFVKEDDDQPFDEEF